MWSSVDWALIVLSSVRARFLGGSMSTGPPSLEDRRSPRQSPESEEPSRFLVFVLTVAVRVDRRVPTAGAPRPFLNSLKYSCSYSMS